MDPTHERGASLDVSFPADPRCIPLARQVVCRWMLRRHLDEGVIHALDGLDLHVEETDGGFVRVEVRGAMTPEPRRLRAVADRVQRRREALLSALCRGHDRAVGDDGVTLWAEVRADREGF